MWTGAQWRNLGILAGDFEARPNGINALDEIVGTSFDYNGGYRPFLWNGTMSALACPSRCDAVAINDGGTIVGSSDTSALVWLRGSAYDLNTLIDPRDALSGQVNLFFCAAVNNRGEIVCDGVYQSGPGLYQFDAFLLTPVPAVAGQ
jgi:hypothetical protein